LDLPHLSLPTFFYDPTSTKNETNPKLNSTHLAHLRVTRHVGLIGHWACYTAQLCPFCHVAHLLLALSLVRLTDAPPHCFWPSAMGIPSPRQMSTQSPPNHPRTTHSLESRVSEKPSVGVTCWRGKKPFNRFLVLVLVLVFPSLLVK